MNHVRRFLALLLAGCIAGSSLLLAACNRNGSENDTVTESDTESHDSTAATISYKVTVQDADGAPASDIIVKVQKDGTDTAFKIVDSNGSATFELTADAYTVRIESPSGATFYYDTDAAVLTADTPELTVRIYNTAATQKLMAPTQTGDEYIRFDAALVGEGKTYVPFNTGDHTYAIFTPTRAGIYEITYECAHELELTYHGGTVNVFPTSLLDAVDGVITFSVPASSIGETLDATAQYVLRLNPSDGTESGCIISVTRTGDVPKTPADEPWTVPTAIADALIPYEGSTEGTLTDLDVTDPSLTVFLGEDGYYHLGTADGPVVFLRLSSENPYMSDFKTICDSARICAYFYDEEGTFLRRESYNELIAEYLTVANADGVVPLNDQLATMVKNAGNHMGWWNFSDGLDIFDGKIVDPAVAWLFACAYYK